MNNLSYLWVFIFLISCEFANQNETIRVVSEVNGAKDNEVEKIDVPENVVKLLNCYPDITEYKDNYVYFSDGSKLIYDDGKEKTFDQLLDEADIEDMFRFKYKKWDSLIPFQYDPGRIRNEDFFKKIYGSSKSAVQNHLTKISWCPKLVNQEILVTTKNDLHLKIDSLSKELDTHPEFKKYIQNIGGTFVWRKISGTDRLSMHSFGMTIDINVSFSNYWQWDCGCKSESTVLKEYSNRIPLELVRIFEKYGFIWGGNWYHFDTMHFEYRPELL